MAREVLEHVAADRCIALEMREALQGQEDWVVPMVACLGSEDNALAEQIVLTAETGPGVEVSFSKLWRRYREGLAAQSAWIFDHAKR